jgi:hypothetical protein
MVKAIAGIVIVIFDAILVKAWFTARAAAALGHGPAPSTVKYAIILGFSAAVLIALLRGKSSSSRNGGSRNGGSPYTWSGR